MKSSASLWQFVGFAVVSFLGTLLHFLYDWTKSNIAALFSGVNESTWEHMKLLFVPFFIFSIIEWLFIGKRYGGFWCVKLKGALLGITLIPLLFYTYNGAFGTSPDWINISIFFISAAVAFWWQAGAFKQDIPCKQPYLALTFFIIIALSFAVFTFYPPEIPLFKDPISGQYGIPKP